MGLETGNYPSFLGGVSQQDDTVRSPTQLTTAINAWLHAAMGAGKRPPATFKMHLGSDIDPMSYFHSIDRDDYERYIVVVGHKSVRVFDHVSGKEYDVVVTGDALEYLDTHGRQPWTVFKAVTLADTTFIVNRNTQVEMSTEVSTGTVRGTVQTLGDLPTTGVSVGAVYHVTGTEEMPFDDFYVEKAAGNAWVETAKPNVRDRFLPSSMPHVLKRIPDEVHADGFFFSFGAPDWAIRMAGDDGSNPEPSFVGQTIRDVFHHRNRLCFLSTENVLMSEVGAPFNFWRTTVTQVLDSDPIDIAVPTNGVAQLHHGVSFQSAVHLSASNAQYLLSAEPYMSAKHVKTDPINNYACSPYIRPQLMGDSLYFVDDSGTHACIREYFMDDLSITGDAADVTAHVPKYVPGRIRAMTAATAADCVLFAVDAPKDSQLYVYFVRWAGDEKQQSAWTEWKVEGVGKIVHLHTLDNTVYAVAEAPGGGVDLVTFELMLNQDDADATKDYTFLLDRLALVEPRYTALGNYTEITLPYLVESLEGLTAIKTDAWDDPGAYYDLTGATLVDGGQTIRLPGEHIGGTVAIGYDYAHKMTLTKPILRQRDGSAIIVGRTQVRDLEVAYKDAAYFEVEVENKSTQRTERYLASHAHAFTARVMDDSEFRLSAPSFHSGSRRFPILANADNVRISLVNRLPFQCWFQSGQWRGLFVSRSRV